MKIQLFTSLAILAIAFTLTIGCGEKTPTPEQIKIAKRQEIDSFAKEFKIGEYAKDTINETPEEKAKRKRKLLKFLTTPKAANSVK